MLFVTLAAAVLAATPALGGQMSTIPEDFPRFAVPGHQADMDALREMLWLHFLPDGPDWDTWLNGTDGFPMYPTLPSGPKATLWDEWLCASMLWPAVETGGIRERMQERWRTSLLERRIDDEGYVETKQGTFYAHNLGWPFPVWSHGAGFGWHFTFKGQAGELGTPNGRAYRPPSTCDRTGWKLTGAEDKGLDADGWHIVLTAPGATAEAPDHEIDTLQAPFLQIRWRAPKEPGAAPYIEWATKENPVLDSGRRMYFDPPDGQTQFIMVPIYKHPKWTRTVTHLRIGFGNKGTGAPVTLLALFTQYDTRHNINNLNYVRGCAIYFHWTHDIGFLRQNMNRIRTAMASFIREHHVREARLVLTTWPGHDGLSKKHVRPDGTAWYEPGHGMPNNYWDIIPYGHKDCYATVHLYDALLTVAGLEREIAAHPGWNIPSGPLTLDSGDLERLAKAVRSSGNHEFWSAKTGRFVAGIDAEGRAHDYGFTSLNLEAIHYGFAMAEHARSILSWICGERTVAGDTSKGADIYKFRFAARTNTKRNKDYWYWAAAPPDGAPFGWNVQDGGAILGFSFYDVMARLRERGPDDAWKRLSDILSWFEDVQQAGGYKAYYAKAGGALQGANVGGNLGITSEFFESVMVPQVMLNGFLGFRPTGDGFSIRPKLPAGWPSLTLDRIRYRDMTLRITVTRTSIEIGRDGWCDESVCVSLPSSRWRISTPLPGASVVRGHAWLPAGSWDSVRFDLAR